MIKIKNLDDLLENNLKGKTVYLRADLNLPTINGKVTDTTRIKSILPTIRELKKNKCKICMCIFTYRSRRRLSSQFTGFVCAF